MNDVYRLERYIYPIVGDLPIDAFALDHAEEIMRRLPPGRCRSPGARRHIAQIVHRICTLAVFPLRYIKTNPLPRGFLPKLGNGKAKGWVYPDEDAILLASIEVPLSWRFFYGFLHREGLRRSEAARLRWRDLDLDRGSITVDVNKTEQPRVWALSPGVAAAFRTLHALRVAQGLPAGPDDLVFLNDKGRKITKAHGADRYREHLIAAGITRPELFASTETRQQLRLHDARASFITIALANGKSETWVQDRTGHTSSVMINRYRRAARTAAELGLGDFRPLIEAIPELAGQKAAETAAPTGSGGTKRAKKGVISAL